MKFVLSVVVLALFAVTANAQYVARARVSFGVGGGYGVQAAFAPTCGVQQSFAPAFVPVAAYGVQQQFAPAFAVQQFAPVVNYGVGYGVGRGFSAAAFRSRTVAFPARQVVRVRAVRGY